MTQTPNDADWWADARLGVFAVLMGARIPALAERLARDAPAGSLCLAPGAPAADACWLAELKPDAVLTAWLLQQPDGWGLLLRSEAPLLALRRHLRGLGTAQGPEGEPMTLDWMDPPVLRALLPGFDRAQRAAFFGPVSSMVLPGPGPWTRVERAG